MARPFCVCIDYVGTLRPANYAIQKICWCEIADGVAFGAVAMDAVDPGVVDDAHVGDDDLIGAGQVFVVVALIDGGLVGIETGVADEDEGGDVAFFVSGEVGEFVAGNLGTLAVPSENYVDMGAVDDELG